MKTKNLFLLVFILLISCKNNQETENIKWNLSVLTSANSWVYQKPGQTEKMISKEGIQNWTDPDSRIRTYFRIEEPGEISIGIRARVKEGTSSIKLTFNGKSKEFRISGKDLKDNYIASFRIDTPGYYFTELQGIKKEGETFAEITDILLSGKATEGKTYFVKEDIYWGRRGPSVHLNYKIPEEADDVVWFYNEMTIEKGQDVIGSYFMANGFGEGYFGIQVNSDTLRTVLFSVWSPFKTDDPKSIPDDQKIILLKKGKNVLTAEFGNEGSGGQSRYLYNWKAGNTYKFLTKVSPSKNNSTDYTAYFYAPETGKWKLIASFRRPKTSTYYTRPHSFLENFIPETGDLSRKVMYGNQWVYDKKGKWHELTEAKFTADATARKDSRLDYTGGTSDDRFYLKNCGFFNERTEIGTILKRESKGNPPRIDFDLLP
jgi:hypothetical protein